jgi:hypothetical protein
MRVGTVSQRELLCPLPQSGLLFCRRTVDLVGGSVLSTEVRRDGSVVGCSVIECFEGESTTEVCVNASETVLCQLGQEGWVVFRVAKRDDSVHRNE